MIRKRLREFSFSDEYLEDLPNFGNDNQTKSQTLSLTKLIYSNFVKNNLII